MQLDCYLHIPDGRCEEALAFYQSIFGGSYDISRFGDRPDSQTPEHWKNKVIHSTFKADGVTFMASDGMPESARSSNDSNISLSISNQDATEGQRLFDALADGGVVSMPFQKTFWGAHFGMLVDKFGIHWMVNSFS